MAEPKPTLAESLSSLCQDVRTLRERVRELEAEREGAAVVKLETLRSWISDMEAMYDVFRKWPEIRAQMAIDGMRTVERAAIRAAGGER